MAQVDSIHRRRSRKGNSSESDIRKVRGAARFALLPDLIPADELAREEQEGVVNAIERHGIHLTARSVQDETTDFRKRAEVDSAVARLTVYTLNVTIMVFAFPIGFGLLIFNILGGENLRTTAHAMALTGLAVALGMNNMGLGNLAGV